MTPIRVILSPSPCLRRIQRLEESRVILGYVALLDAQKLGLDLLAYVNDLATCRRGPALFEPHVRSLQRYLANGIGALPYAGT